MRLYNFDENGIKSDTKKTKAIIQMTTPPNITELQRFLRIPNLGLFICNLSANNKAGIQWHIQQEKFENLGTEITRASALRYFNSCKKLTMSVDASELAVNATIMHDYNAIANGSSTLTEDQKNYTKFKKNYIYFYLVTKNFSNIFLDKKFYANTS